MYRQPARRRLQRRPVQQTCRRPMCRQKHWLQRRSRRLRSLRTGGRHRERPLPRSREARPQKHPGRNHPVPVRARGRMPDAGSRRTPRPQRRHRPDRRLRTNRANRPGRADRRLSPSRRPSPKRCPSPSREPSPNRHPSRNSSSHSPRQHLPQRT